MKIALLDHPLHKKTRSSDFFVNLLKRYHDVVVYYPGGEWRYVLEEVIHSDCELAICWQHEFMAPPLAQHGIRTIIIPMYDGAGAMPKVYWRFFAALGIDSLNFSACLNHKHLVAGIQSSYVQYYPNPDDFEPVSDFSCLRGFIWQRKPEHFLHWHTAMRLTCGQLDHLHVHDVPDSLPALDIPKLQDFPRLAGAITRSEWFESKQDFIDTLNRSNLFIAPRLNEGIGMALLEAMAQGQCVLAHNDSTHNEYIQNGHNGLLFDASNPQLIDLSAAEKLGQAARQSIVNGHQKWLKEQDNILWKVEHSSKPTPAKENTKSAALACDFPQHYYKGFSSLFKKLASV
jgi:glycosyltransferase involved in cell wall biosynthesis